MESIEFMGPALAYGAAQLWISYLSFSATPTKDAFQCFDAHGQDILLKLTHHHYAQRHIPVWNTPTGYCKTSRRTSRDDTHCYIQSGVHRLMVRKQNVHIIVRANEWPYRWVDQVYAACASRCIAYMRRPGFSLSANHV